MSYTTKAQLTDDEVYDIMSIINDKLSPESIRFYFNKPEWVNKSSVLNAHEKERLLLEIKLHKTTIVP